MLGYDVVRYDFDQAVRIFGSRVESLLEEVESTQKDPKRAKADEKRKRTEILYKYRILKASDAPKKPASSFADPAKLVQRRS